MVAKMKKPMGGRGKPGPASVGPSARGSSPSRGVPGGPGRSFPQEPIPGPATPGQPVAMKRALAKKRPSPKGQDFPGLVK